VLVDPRSNSKADVLWDGAHLYVASAGPSGSQTSDSARILRFSYDGVTESYTLDTGFPVTVTTAGMEAIVLAKDTTGMLWLTYTDNLAVYVAHSTTDDVSWTVPYVLPVAGAANLISDDLSAIVAFNSQIGIMWSNQNDDAMYFATHSDGAADDQWASNPAIQDPGYADDHISIKSLQGDSSGQVFAAVKTSLNDSGGGPGAPLILLLVLAENGSWSRHTFGRVSDDHTRPIVLIDEENRDVYVFATVPVGSATSGAIYYKKSSLDNISFPTGLGTPYIWNSTDDHINNATSTKQNLNSATDLLMIAGDDNTRYYLHNTIDLAAGPP
jgi:hypothetical protein